jgi:hypothetical protein
MPLLGGAALSIIIYGMKLSASLFKSHAVGWDYRHQCGADGQMDGA